MQTKQVSFRDFLVCDHVTATFGSLVAVNQLSLQVTKGEVIGIGGPNGAGKTTLLDLISGLLPLSEGEVIFQGTSLKGKAPHQICHAGMARTFQLNAGFESLTALDNVMVATTFGNADNAPGLLFDKNHVDRSHALLEEFGLSDITHKLVGDSTILERKKLMVATALATNPKIILLDEPVAGLTPSEIDEFINVIDKLKRNGLTIVFIEHVMRFLTTVASRAVMMNHGSIIYDGSPFELANDETVAEVYLGTSATVESSLRH